MQHPYYSHTPNIKLLNERTSNLKYVLRILTTNNEQEHKRMEELISKKITNKNNYLTKLEQYFTEHERTYCGNQSKFYLLFSVQQGATPKDLPFPNSPHREEALISGLNSLVKALLSLKVMQTPHGNISPQNVYIIKDRLVLSDPWIAPEGVDLADRFPSPEKLLKMNSQVEDYDPYASDLFSIAMTVLEMAKQDKLERIYKKNYSLNRELLIEELSKCPFGRLREILRYLLLSSESNRVQYLLDCEARYHI